jgi:hypothetical protein
VLNKVKAEKRKRKSENHHTYNNRKKIKVVNRKENYEIQSKCRHPPKPNRKPGSDKNNLTKKCEIKNISDVMSPK